MKHKKYGTFFSALTAFCLAAALLFSLKAEAAPPAENSGRQLDVVFLHDTHSHLDSFFTVEDGQRTTVGGFAHIKTLIDQAREKNPNLLVLDGGDFSMGTLVQTIYDSDAPELRMLGLLGCDVTTLGNHEFDYRSAGLAGALKAAKESGDPIPAMVLCNIDWETMEAEGLTEDQRLLKDAFEGYGMKNYIIVEKGDVRIAVFGIFGVDSLACAPTCVLKFRDASQAAAETVREIRENEDVDMIAGVSHAGTSPDESKSEDEILAKAVPEIDLIISGHTHTALEEPILQGDTYIVSCGEYGKNLGTLSMRQKADGRWEIENYALVPVTPDITPDVSAQEKIDSFMEIVNQSYLSRFGYTRDQVLVQSNIAFSPSSDLYDVHTDHNLGNILADSFIHAVETAEDFDGHPVDVAIVPSGCVRDSFAAGNITVEDVFNAYSLGIGLDGIAGYPLISIYLTGAELKTGAEIDASVSDLMPAARLYVSGMHFSFNPDRLILNRVTKCYLVDRDGNPVEIQDDKLYRVVCDLYSGQMLGAVTDVSYRILSIQPKFADGTPIENIEDAIITSNGRELKAWAAIAGYMNSFPDTDGDGTADMPAVYAQALGSKTVEETHSLLDLIKKPNKYVVIIVLILLAVLALIVLLIVLIIKLVKKLLKKKKHKR